MEQICLGEVKLFAFNYAPRGWALCKGQILSIAEHESLFGLLRTAYGGDGRTTFALPDLRDKAPAAKDMDTNYGFLQYYIAVSIGVYPPRS